MSVRYSIRILRRQVLNVVSCGFNPSCLGAAAARLRSDDPDVSTLFDVEAQPASTTEPTASSDPATTAELRWRFISSIPFDLRLYCGAWLKYTAF